MSEVELSELPQAGGYTVTLPTFEGPLDLLLHLCQKHELDILDIPIGFVTEKYLEYLAVMQLMSLDVASEYLVMAATLAHIKSKMLLPAPPPGQEDELAAEEEDPREALIRRLLEYQKYKHAGEELSSRGVAGRDVFMRGMPIEEAVHTGLPPLAQVPLFSLVEAFQNVLSKSSVKLSHDIVHERVTLADRINELVDILRVRRRIVFEELFEGLETRFDLVITFLALLEMTRLRMTRLYQENFESPIFIEFTAQVTADDDAEAGSTGTTSEGDGATSTDALEGAAEGAAEGRTSLDTEAPPPGRMSFDELLATGEAVRALDTEAPPSIELEVPGAEDDESGAAPLQTIPAPAPDDSEEAHADRTALSDEASTLSPHTDDETASDEGWTSGDDTSFSSSAANEDPAGEPEPLDDSDRSTLLDVRRGEDTLDEENNSVFDGEGGGETSSTSTQDSDERGGAAPSGDEDT